MLNVLFTQLNHIFYHLSIYQQDYLYTFITKMIEKKFMKLLLVDVKELKKNYVKHIILRECYWLVHLIGGKEDKDEENIMFNHLRYDNYFRFNC